MVSLFLFTTSESFLLDDFRYSVLDFQVSKQYVLLW